MAFTPQTSVSATPVVAYAGMPSDGLKDDVSLTLTADAYPGLFVCGDHLTAEPPDAAADVTGHSRGIVLREELSAPGARLDGECVSVRRIGRSWATTLAGAAPTDGAAVYVYRGATVANRGKVTQDSGAADVTRAEGCKFTGNTGSGIAEIQNDGGSASNGLAVVASELAAVANGQGASLVGIEDAGAFTTEVDTEGALQEIFLQLYSVQRDIPVLGFPTAGILAAGTPMAAWADNAGASAPGVTLANSECMGLRWNNFATQTAVWFKAHFPQNVDDGADIVMHVQASKIGSTVGDATTFTVTAFCQKPGTLHDADANFGGATSAMTGDAATKTSQEVTLTLAAADIPAAPFNISFSIKPTDGTLGTDDVVVEDIWFEIKSKKVAS